MANYSGYQGLSATLSKDASTEKKHTFLHAGGVNQLANFALMFRHFFLNRILALERLAPRRLFVFHGVGTRTCTSDLFAISLS